MKKGTKIALTVGGVIAGYFCIQVYRNYRHIHDSNIESRVRDEKNVEIEEAKSKVEELQQSLNKANDKIKEATATISSMKTSMKIVDTPIEDAVIKEEPQPEPPKKTPLEIAQDMLDAGDPFWATDREVGYKLAVTKKYEEITFTYFADDVLADDQDDIIEENKWEDILPSDQSIAERMEMLDEDVVYVVHPKYEAIYEIVRDIRDYEDYMYAVHPERMAGRPGVKKWELEDVIKDDDESDDYESQDFGR